MNKQYRISQFEQLINHIQLSLDIAEEVDLEEVKDKIEALLSGLDNMYDEFALELNYDGKKKNNC